MDSHLNPVKLVNLFSSYIFHDLASPLSAVLTGLDLIEPADSSQAELLSLVKKSTNSFVNRLEFLRLAYGSNQKCHSVHEICNFLKKFLALQGRVVLDWPVETVQIPIDPNISSLLLILASWLSLKGAWGGRLCVQCYPDGGQFDLTLQGEKLLPIDPDEQRLFGGELPLDAISSPLIPVYWSWYRAKLLNKMIILSSSHEFSELKLCVKTI